MTHRGRGAQKTLPIAVLALLGASLLCFALAPLLMPDTYSIMENAISESGAQGVENAWLARTGFLLLGFAVLALGGLRGPSWGVWGRLAFYVYGVAIIAAAAFSHMPWEDVPYDVFEDFLHSVAASTVGASFTIGVLLVSFRRGSGSGLARVIDLIAMTAAVVITILMFNMEGIAGLVQRIMFGIAYLWFGIEAVRKPGHSLTQEVALASGQTGGDRSKLARTR